MTDRNQDTEHEGAQGDLGLFKKLGPRPIGSEAEMAVLEHVEGVAHELGLVSTRHEFEYLGWRQVSPPSLSIGPDRSPLSDVRSFTYSPSTDPSGVSGVLEWVGENWTVRGDRWQKFRIADAATGSTVGYVSGVPDGPAVPQALAEGASMLPHFIVGSEDLRRIEDAFESSGKVEVRGKNETRLRPGARGFNLVVAIPGREDDGPFILTCGHADHIGSGPRAEAEDRALSFVVNLVRSLASKPPRYTMKVVIFWGAGGDMVGSKAYLADHPDALNASLVVNLEEIPDDAPLLLASIPEAFETALYDDVKSLGLDCAIEYRSPVPSAGDHAPFAVGGTPVLLIGRGKSTAHDGHDDVRDSQPTTLADVSRIVAGVVDEMPLPPCSKITKHVLLSEQRGHPKEHLLSLKHY